VRLSRDHKPGDASEHKRIEALGGTVTTTIDMWGNIISRIKGQLSVSRSLGDFPLTPFVIPTPEVEHHELNLHGANPTAPVACFLVLACDGLWDVLSDEDAIHIANSYIFSADPEVAAQKLRDYAYTEGSKDNISV
jgi:serine/threonine protein phosphatase PrpC